MILTLFLSMIVAIARRRRVDDERSPRRREERPRRHVCLCDTRGRSSSSSSSSLVLFVSCRCLSILSSIPCRLRLCLGFHYIFFFPCNGRFSLFDQKPKTHTHALLFLFTQVAYKHLKPTTGRDILNLSLSLCLCVCHVVVF